MSAPLTPAQARAIGVALTQAADEAEAAGKNTVDYTESAFKDLDASIEDAQAAVDEARKAGQS